MNHQLG